MKIVQYLQIKHNIARRKIVQCINSGGIICNGTVVEGYWTQIWLGDHIVITAYSIDEKVTDIELAKSQIICYHKPVWYTVSKHDKHNQTIYDILPKEFIWFDYIWRLDKQSSGLLLLTNDKRLVHELGHPSNGYMKTYKVRVDTYLSNEEVEQCTTGLWLDEDGWLLKQWQGDLLKFENVYQEQRNHYTQLTIQLYEWHKRHIRRLLKALWKKIYTLHRTAFGKYKLWDVKVWEWLMMDYH